MLLHLQFCRRSQLSRMACLKTWDCSDRSVPVKRGGPRVPLEICFGGPPCSSSVFWPPKRLRSRGQIRPPESDLCSPRSEGVTLESGRGLTSRTVNTWTKSVSPFHLFRKLTSDPLASFLCFAASRSLRSRLVVWFALWRSVLGDRRHEFWFRFR